MERFSPQHHTETIQAQVQATFEELRRRDACFAWFPVLAQIPLAKLDVLEWTRLQSGHPVVYWRNREQSTEIGGWGNLLEYHDSIISEAASAYSVISDLLDSHPQGSFLNFIGGAQFNLKERRDRSWVSFPRYWFFQPEVTLLRKGDTFSLTLGVLVGAKEKPSDVVSRLQRLLDTVVFDSRSEEGETIPNVISRSDSPARDAWNHILDIPLQKIFNQEIQKVVLARKTELSFDAPLHAFALLERLREMNMQSYSFCLAPDERNAFLSVSPERLFKLEGTTIISEALGATASRGLAAEEDLHQAKELLESDKAQREHGFVVSDLKKKFAQLAGDFTVAPNPELVKLADVQHLMTRIKGEVKKGLSLGQIVSSLHPTPAVCGVPKNEAEELIAELEPFSRGWYAGPVGRISADETEFAVAIRSLLVQGTTASVFGGAGIVDGSDAGEEWIEVENKMRTAFRVLGNGSIPKTSGTPKPQLSVYGAV